MIKVLEKVKYVLIGGIEAFVFGTAEKISSNKEIKIEIFTDNAPGAKKYTDIAKETDIHIFSGKDHTKKSKPVRMASKWIDFFKFSKTNHYELIHIHMCRPYDVLYAIAARFSGNKKVLLHAHGSQPQNICIVERLANNLFRALSRRIGNKFAACSENAAKYMFGKTDFILLKNGIDASAFSYSLSMRTAERERMDLFDSFVIGNVGRLCILKNQTFLLDIFSEILKIRSNSILVIAGDGELSDSLREKAKALDISEKVVFCGSVDNVSALYQAFDCFVFPSLSEGLGIAAVEAQTSGLITVCSDGVPKEAAVTELCSFMPLSASPKEWAEHILSACNGYERRSYAEEIKAAGYDINDTAKQLEEIYLSLE